MFIRIKSVELREKHSSQTGDGRPCLNARGTSRRGTVDTKRVPTPRHWNSTGTFEMPWCNSLEDQSFNYKIVFLSCVIQLWFCWMNRRASWTRFTLIWLLVYWAITQKSTIASSCCLPRSPDPTYFRSWIELLISASVTFSIREPLEWCSITFASWDSPVLS